MIAETLFGMSEACWILTIAGILLLALAVIGTIKLVSCETARHGLAKVLTFTVVCMWMCYIAADKPARSGGDPHSPAAVLCEADSQDSQSPGEKPTRSGASTRLPDACDVGESEGFADMPCVSNLTVAAILRGSNETANVVAWHPSFRPLGDLVDFYGGTNLTNFARLFTLDVAQCASNALVVVADEDVSGMDCNTQAFFSVGDATDTDGDGLSDSDERFIYKTNADDSDTDDDGLSDGEEIAMGSSPLAADTDGDGLSDGEELGRTTVVVGPLWIDTAYGDFDDIAYALSTSHCGCARWELPMPLTMQGTTVSNVTVSSKGAVFFNRAGYDNPGMDVGALDFSSPIEPRAVVAAPMSDDGLFFRTNAPVSSVKVGMVAFAGSQAVCISYENMGREGDGAETNTVSFQVVVRTHRPDELLMLYRYNVGDAVDGRNAGIGVQSMLGRRLYRIAYKVPGFVEGGKTVIVRLGTDTDPASSDTDGDGLSDGAEIGCQGLPSIGTNPFLWDTDGDCLPDGWENANDLDPLSDIGDDGADGDPDEDGLSNFTEYAVGANPQSSYTFSPDVGDSTYVGYGMCAFPPLNGVEVSISVGDPSGSHSERWKMTLEEEGGFGRRYQIVCNSYGTVNTSTVVLEPGRHYIGRIEHLATNGMLADYDWMAQIDGLPTTKVMSSGREQWTCIADKLVMIDNESGLLGSCDQGFGTENYAEDKHFDVYTVSVWPTNVKFNWNPDSSVNDAINLRCDYNTPYNISNGEYTPSYSYPVCYVTNVVPVVKAKFRVVPEAVSSLELDAVLNGTLLSDLGATTVSFTSGESGYADFTMSGAVASVVGLNASNSYAWRVRAINGVSLSSPISVASTGPHKTYVILGEPVEPWSNEPNVRNNAWSTALDLTCQWASGKTTQQQVATAVTKEINECDRFVYDIAGGVPYYTRNNALFLGEQFDLTAFIDRVNGGEGAGILVNCRDCASAVVSLSNLVGCDLWCNRMGKYFKTRMILPIGCIQLSEEEFTFHEVAWEGQCRDQDLVYDSCLQYDVDETPGVEPFVLDSPCGVMFSDGSELSPLAYRERLAKDGEDGYGSCVNLNKVKRRAIK